MDRHQIYSGVREVLADVLQVDQSEITEDQNLHRDLGIESIDYLDLWFKLEKRFRFKIPKDELFPYLSEQLRHPDFHESGDVISGDFNRLGVAALRRNYPHFNWEGFDKNPSKKEVAAREDVRSIVNYLEKRLTS